MLDKYVDSQKMFYDYFIRSNNGGHLSHAYLLETKGVSYSFNLAIDLAKFFLCNGIYDEKICTLIDNGNYPNLKIIGNNTKIKKDDIVSLKTDFSMKSVDDKRQVYILCDVENLNKSAANSLLKFLEEPDGDVIAILLCNTVSNVLPTIVSRCQIVNLINDDNVYEGIFVSLYDGNSDISYNDFVNKYVSQFFEIYHNIETMGASVLANPDIYELKDQFFEFLCFGYYLYYDALNYLLGRSVKCSSFKFDIKKITEKSNTRDIIKKMEIIDKFIFDLKYNVNINLFIDNFVISMGCV